MSISIIPDAPPDGERQTPTCHSDVSLYIPNLLDPEGDDGDLVDCLTAALRYAAAGWYVLPVLPGSKHPGSVVGARWQELSTRDPQVIAAHWTMTDYGIALHAGRSGAVIFDVDRPELLPEPLLRAIRECNPPHQSTRDNDPGRGHYVFRVPPGRRLGNSRGRLFDAGTDAAERRHAWGEVRGANGVIVVSPSLHEKHAEGGRYLWT